MNLTKSHFRATASASRNSFRVPTNERHPKKRRSFASIRRRIAELVVLAMLAGGALSEAHADTYQYNGGTFGNPDSWIDTNTGGHGIPTSADTVVFNDGTMAVADSDLTFGVIVCGGTLTLTGGSLTAGQVEARLYLQTTTLTIENAGGLTNSQVFVQSGSQLTAMADPGGDVEVQGGIFLDQDNFGLPPSPVGAILNVTSGGSATIGGNALLFMQGTGTVDANCTLSVQGDLSLADGGFVVQNGGAVTSGSGSVGPDDFFPGGFNSAANVTLTGNGSQWTVNGLLQAGMFAAAPGPSVEMVVQNGATLRAQSFDIGVGAQGPADVTAGGTSFLPATSGGSIFVTGPVRVGVAAITNGGVGTLTIHNGSSFEMSGAAPLELGVEAGSDGRFAVSDPDSIANIGATPIRIGEAGQGVFTVSGSNSFVSGPVQVAIEATSGNGTQGDSSLNVQDLGSSWTINGDLSVGVAGNASAMISEGAQLVSSGDAVLGQEANAVGLADVWGLSGDGTSTVLTQWFANGGLTVGESGSGTLDLEWGGNVVLGGDLTLGEESGSTGAVTVVGTPLPAVRALLDVSAASMTVGDSGQGNLTASLGGQVLSGATDIGSEATGNGTVTLTDSGTTWGVAGDLTVGSEGKGTLLSENQAALSINGALIVGDETTAKGSVTITGPGTLVTVNDGLTNGGAGTGTTLVQLGGMLTTDSATLADEANSTGKLTVSGGNAVFATRTDLTVGEDGVGGLTVIGPGTVQTGKDATIAEGLNSLSTVSLSAGGVWIVEGDLTVGGAGIAGMSASTSAQLLALGSMTLAEQSGSGATLTFDGLSTNGVPAKLTYAGELVVGEHGNAKFTLTNGATALIATNGSGVISLAPNPTATATVTVAGTNSFLQANMLEVAVGEGDLGGLGTNTLLLGGQVGVAREVETGEGGVINVRGGSFTLGATNPVAAMGSLQVNPGGRLTGCGHIKGEVINDGGEIAPGCSPGTLTIQGDYTQTGAGILTVGITGGLGGSDSNDVLSVSGAISVAGTLNLAFMGGFAPAQGQSFVFLTAGSGVTGNFDQVSVTGLAPGFQYTVTNSTGGAMSLTALNDGVATSPPLLSISSNAGQLLVTWPASAPGYTLQSTTNLAIGPWINLTGATNAFSPAPTNPTEFFRLVK